VAVTLEPTSRVASSLPASTTLRGRSISHPPGRLVNPTRLRCSGTFKGRRAYPVQLARLAPRTGWANWSKGGHGARGHCWPNRRAWCGRSGRTSWPSGRRWSGRASWSCRTQRPCWCRCCAGSWRPHRARRSRWSCRASWPGRNFGLRCNIGPEATIAQGQHGQSLAVCPAGTVPLGGGFSTTSANNSVVLQNNPFSHIGLAGWNVVAYNSTSDATLSVTAYVICGMAS
jgi:hypothetical protein